MTDPNTPLRDLLNRSGIPFQLAVENKICTIGSRYGVNVVGREVPWTNGFVDVVAEKYISNDFKILFAFECKRVDDKPWVFVISHDQGERVTRCRLEWLNTQVAMPSRPSPGHSRVFCAEWNMDKPSPESDFCIVPKGTPIPSLEAVCKELLSGCHHLLAEEEIAHRKNFVPVVVPVVMTTAQIYTTCKFDPAAVTLETGKLDLSDGQFAEANFVRFRKSLVTVRSNSYNSSEMALKDWVADRERTVFVLRPSALETFLDGFRSFFAPSSNGYPKEFTTPPQLQERH